MSRQRLTPVDRWQNRQSSQSSDTLPVVADTAQRLKVAERGGSTVRFRYDMVTLKVVGIGQPTRPASVVVCCDTSQSQCPWNQSFASILCHCRSPFRPPLGGAGSVGCLQRLLLRFVRNGLNRQKSWTASSSIGTTIRAKASRAISPSMIEVVIVVHPSAPPLAGGAGSVG